MRSTRGICCTGRRIGSKKVRAAGAGSVANIGVPVPSLSRCFPNAPPASRTERRHAIAGAAAAAGARSGEAGAGRRGGTAAIARALGRAEATVAAQRRSVVCGQRPRAVSVPAPGLGPHRGGPLGAAARDHRRRQDLRRLLRGAQPRPRRRNGRRRPALPVDHADARAGRRYRPRAGRPVRRPGPRLAGGRAHRRHRRRRARAAGQAAAGSAGHHAGEPVAAARPRRLRRPVRASCAGGRRRMARADRQQARRAGAAGAGAPAPVRAALRLGPERHARQPRRGAARAAGRQPERAGRRTMSCSGERSEFAA